MIGLLFMVMKAEAEQHEDVSVSPAGWTTADPPESSSSWCPESCSTPTMASLNTRPMTPTPSRSAPCQPLWTTTMNGERATSARPICFPLPSACLASLLFFPKNRRCFIRFCVETCISCLSHSQSPILLDKPGVCSGDFGKGSP